MGVGFAQAGMAAHSWERPARQHSWEVRAPQPSDSDDEGPWGEPSSGDENIPPATAGEELVAVCRGYLSEHVLNAKQFCTIMYWASKAGVVEAQQFSLQPGASSGHFQRKLDRCLSGELYKADIPGHDKHAFAKTVHSVPVRLPFRFLEDAMQETGFQTRLREMVTSEDIADAYHRHPVVLREPEHGAPTGLVLPLSLYMDGVPYSQTDSILGVWLDNMLDGKRILIAILRKRRLCKCGCRGWCSLWALFDLIRWILASLAQGFWPTQRHDGEPWRTDDASLQARAGQPFPARAAVVFVKGDWAEYASSLGFPNWNDGFRPCFECVACGPDMYVSRGNNCEGLRWRRNQDGDYNTGCRRCEVHVPLTHDTRAMIVDLLRFDKRASGSRGLALIRDVPELGLLAGDRLEPSRTLRNVSFLEDLELPATVTFWRCSEETLARHRNPLFHDSTGLTPKQNVTIDLLHTLNLGVMKVWCGIAIWLLLQGGVYASVGTAEERTQSGLLAMRHALMAWYKKRRAEKGAPRLTEVSDLTINMIGSPTGPTCKTKGAETYGMLLFLVQALHLHRERLGQHGTRLHRAGSALCDLVDLWAGSGGPPRRRNRNVVSSCTVSTCT